MCTWFAALHARLVRPFSTPSTVRRSAPARVIHGSLSGSDLCMTLTPFERGLVAHLVADWILQNDWMARNKMSLRHPDAWTHASIHAVCLGLALGWQAGLVLGFIH